MRPVSSSLAIALTLALALASLGGVSCSSMEKPADGGPAGTGGATPAGVGGAGGGRDTSCIDGSDGCVWSCGAGEEMGTGDSPHPYCDAEGRFQCPIGSQTLSTCPEGSCARFDLLCCDLTTGHTGPPPCKPDGFRDVCPAGSGPDSSRCRAPGLDVSNCFELDQKPCGSSTLECHGGGDCACKARGDGTLLWDCPPYIP